MQESDNQDSYNQIPKWNNSFIISCLVSLLSVLFTQFTLFLLPLFLSSSSFLILLPLSVFLFVIVMGLMRISKRLAGVRASAPAFVFFSIFFTWVVYISVVRRVVSSLEDIVFNTEIILVVIGLFCIMASDPGRVTSHSSCHGLSVESPDSEVGNHEEELKISTFIVEQESPKEDFSVHMRVRYCRHCKTYIRGFDHHCPAFGNCIGQKNHAFFLVLLVGFVVSELSYVHCASQFDAKSQTLAEVGWELGDISRNLVLGTMLFSLIQVLWQVIFVVWHLHCACFNIKTDEWINWKKYPEFQTKISPQAGEPYTATQFVNPYHKGILKNLKEFITAKG